MSTKTIVFAAGNYYTTENGDKAFICGAVPINPLAWIGLVWDTFGGKKEGKPQNVMWDKHGEQLNFCKGGIAHTEEDHNLVDYWVEPYKPKWWPKNPYNRERKTQLMPSRERIVWDEASKAIWEAWLVARR